MTAVFVDIEDSTGIANHFKTQDYRQFLSQYHDVVRTVVDGDSKWDPIKAPHCHNFFGDEFIAFLLHADYGDRSASLALELATKLKLAWYVSPENRERLQSDKEVIEVNVGVNFGAVSRMAYPLGKASRERSTTLEGFPITIAKRAQSVCEQARASRIILADAAYREYVKETHRPHEFDYVGRRPLKGLAQLTSCYEWLGGDWGTFAEFGLADSSTGQVLETLYDKNPLNPWYALLLAFHYFGRAEEDWYAEVRNSPWYGKAAGVCLKALHSIPWSQLRQLSSLFLTCLEVQEQWEELGLRAEQAFTADPTFAQASALRAWALFRAGVEGGQKRDLLQRAFQDAGRTVTLFDRKGPGIESDDETEEALYRAHLVRSSYQAMEEQSNNAKESLSRAVKHAQAARLDWAAIELAELKKKGAFKGVDADAWKGIMKQLRKGAKG